MGGMSRRTEVIRNKRAASQVRARKKREEKIAALPMLTRYQPKFVTNRFGMRVLNPLHGKDLTFI